MRANVEYNGFQICQNVTGGKPATGAVRGYHIRQNGIMVKAFGGRTIAAAKLVIDAGFVPIR